MPPRRPWPLPQRRPGLEARSAACTTPRSGTPTRAARRRCGPTCKHDRRRGRLGRGLHAALRALPAPLRHAAVRPGPPGGHRRAAPPARLRPGRLLVRHLRHLQQGDGEGARVQDRRQPRRERRLLRRQDLQRLRPLRVEAPVARPPARTGARATRARSTPRATSSRRSAATRATPTTSRSPSRAEPPCSLSGVAHAPRHLLAQLHAVAVADVPLLLQVLRVRDAPARTSTRRTRSSSCSTTPRGAG